MFVRIAVSLGCLLLVALPALGKPAEERRIDTKFKDQVTHVEFSGDGKTLAAAAGETLRVFDVAMGGELALCQEARGPFALSKDGRQLAFVAQPERDKAIHEVRIWNVPERKLQASLVKLPGDVQCLAFAPDGTSLAVGYSWTDDKHLVQSRVKTFDTRNGRERAELCQRSCPDSIPGIIAKCGTALAYSPDGKTLAIGGNVGGGPDGEVVFCGVFTARQISSGKVQGGMNLAALAFSPDGKRLVSAGYTASLWDAASGKVLWDQRREVLGGSAVVFDVDGKSVLESGSGGVHKYDVAAGKLVAKSSSPAGAFAFSPDGKRLAVVEGTVIVVYETEALFDK